MHGQVVSAFFFNCGMLVIGNNSALTAWHMAWDGIVGTGLMNPIGMREMVENMIHTYLRTIRLSLWWLEGKALFRL